MKNKNKMKFYKTKTSRISGLNFSEVNKKAQITYKKLKSHIKRTPYLRSAYFNKEKVFLSIFWSHLYEKHNLKDKYRRLRFFDCAIELIQKTNYEPELRKVPGNNNIVLYRFGGSTKDDRLFIVQIKEDLKTKKKYLISIFPE